MTVSDQTPTISVVIPTRNRPGLLLERALPSALGQTYTNVALLVTRGGLQLDYPHAERRYPQSSATHELPRAGGRVLDGP